MKIGITEGIGINITNSFNYLGETFLLFCKAVKNIPVLRNPSIKTILYKQIYYTGIEPLKVIIPIGILIGIVIIAEINNILAISPELAGKLMVWTFIRELGPLLIAIVVITRSCTAITAELASMRLKREIDCLRILGINPIEYLVVPRVIGVSIAIFFLTFFFQVIAITGGLAFFSVITDTNFLYFLKDICSEITLFDLGISLFKSLVFGVVISIISCYKGIKKQSSITEVPESTKKAVVQCLFYIFYFDGIIAIMYLL